MSLPLISKAAARYTGAGGKEHCSLCRHFSPRRGGRCARVLGDISPRGWCRLFSREMRGLVADAASFNGGGGPALGLDFMQPGVLDPRITFTRASTASYFDSAGVMRTATTNTPRWDYDPATLTLRGLLIEEARENRTLQSADLSNAAWQKAGANGPAAPTVTGNQAVAPDGTTTASRIALPAISGAGAVSFVQQPLAAGASVALWTFSIYLKGSVGGEQTYVCIYDGISNYIAKQRVTLTTSWQRYTITSPSNLTTAAWYTFIGTDLRDAGETSTPAATIYAWGGQMEQGAFATSYIPTTSAAVTRAAEQCYIPSASWFSSYTYSLAVEFDTALIARTVAGISDTVFANASYIANGAFVRSASVSGTAVTAGPVNKQCATLVPSTTIRICNNGGAVFTNSSGVAAAQTTATRMSIGCSPWALDNQLCGHIRRVAYYARILTDAEMQTVTTP